MVGGVKYEHTHRMIAEFIGLLIIVMAVWTQRVESRKWMRVLGWTALGAVIGQGILGGITVLHFLPWSISTAHATLAQMIFATVVAMALFTSRAWLQDSQPIPETDLRVSTPTLAAVAAVCVWVQLILGAAFRHSGIKLLPHLIGACVVAAMLLLDRRSRADPLRQCRSPAPARAIAAGAVDDATGTRILRLSYPPDLGTRCRAAHADHGGQHGGARCRRRAGDGSQRGACYPVAPYDRRSRCPAGNPKRTSKGRHRMSSATQPLAVPREGIAALAGDYATLIKARVTTLIVMTAWAGAYFAAAKSGVSSLSWTLLHALIGIGLVSGGTAAINEVVERDIDALMRRTARRPLVTGSMSLLHASVVAFGMTIGGVLYLWATTNWLDRRAGGADVDQLPHGLHADEACASHLHFPGRVSRSHASGAGLDRDSRPARQRSPGAVRHPVLLAVSAFPFHRLALPRGLRERPHPHVASGRKRRPLHRVRHRDVRRWR